MAPELIIGKFSVMKICYREEEGKQHVNSNVLRNSKHLWG